MRIRARELISYQVWTEGHKVGKIRDVCFEDTNWTVRYLIVDTGGWLSHHEVLLIPSVFDNFDHHLRVAHPRLTREQIENSPPVAADMPLFRQYEERLHAYYGWAPYWAGPELGLSPVAMPLPSPSAIAAVEKKLEHANPHLRNFKEIKGYKVRAADGTAGRLDDLLIELESNKIVAVVVDLRDWLPGGQVELGMDAVKTISFEDQEVVVTLDCARIKARPAPESADTRSNINH